MSEWCERTSKQRSEWPSTLPASIPSSLSSPCGVIGIVDAAFDGGEGISAPDPRAHVKLLHVGRVKTGSRTQEKREEDQQEEIECC